MLDCDLSRSGEKAAEGRGGEAKELGRHSPGSAHCPSDPPHPLCPLGFPEDQALPVMTCGAGGGRAV